MALVGDLRWSDAALGWVATWNVEVNGRRYRWSVNGVNYDEAFRKQTHASLANHSCVVSQCGQ
jgi:hypothetical protein